MKPLFQMWIIWIHLFLVWKSFLLSVFHIMTGKSVDKSTIFTLFTIFIIIFLSNHSTCYYIQNCFVLRKWLWITFHHLGAINSYICPVYKRVRDVMVMLECRRFKYATYAQCIRDRVRDVIVTLKCRRFKSSF